MSSTSLYELFSTKVNCVATLRNGHGSGPAIWNYISLKVRGIEFSCFNDKGFWPCYKSDKLDDDEKVVLLATYDNSFVEIANMIEFSESCRKLHRAIIKTTTWEWSHFDAIADSAEKLATKHDPRCRGMAIGCTSVCDVWEQESVKNIDAWGVYGELEAMKTQVA